MVSSSSKSQTQLAIIDGAEWASFKATLAKKDKKKQTSSSSFGGRDAAAAAAPCGWMTIVVGTTTATLERVVGIMAATTTNGNNDALVELRDGVMIHADSMAVIPPSIRDESMAISTMIASLTGIYCALPRLSTIGGATDDSFVSGKVVIMGGNEYACFAAAGLTALGANVTLVTTASSRPKLNEKYGPITVLPPGVDNVGFSSLVGEFDVLLDTMYNEDNLNDVDNDDDDILLLGGVLDLLRTRHACRRYVSTQSKAQSIVQKQGMIFGPGKVNEYMKGVANLVQPPLSSFQWIVPPKAFGRTVQTLLEKDILYPPSFFRKNKDGKLIRGWDMKEFWEMTTWPRDSSNSRGVRYGLPVLEDDDEDYDDDDDDFEFFQRNPASDNTTPKKRQKARTKKTAVVNPYVMDLEGLPDVERNIVATQRNCLLFLKADYCRTCKSMQPQYTRMARNSARDVNSNLLFAQADTTGPFGKQLSKELQIESVPSFVLFRKGKKFGAPLTIAKLPSETLELAIKLMFAGVEYNVDVSSGPSSSSKKLSQTDFGGENDDSSLEEEDNNVR